MFEGAGTGWGLVLSEGSGEARALNFVPSTARFLVTWSPFRVTAKTSSDAEEANSSGARGRLRFLA